LGIPSSKEFFEISGIREAQDLWENLKRRKATEGWKPEAEEECEDEEGNVYTKKTYMDLKRQGLI
jgi:splicing factor 3A subunit 3